MNKIYILLFLVATTLTSAQEKWFVENPNSFDYYLTTEIEDGEIIGMTRDNALKDIVGGIKFMLFKTATSIKYPEIVHFEADIKDNKFKGSLQMIFEQLPFKGVIKNDSLLLTVTNADGSKGQLTGVRVEEINPLRDYKATFEEVFKLTEDNIYNQSFLQSRDWRKFKKKMRKLSKTMNDDLELQIAFFAIAREFPFSHYYIGPASPEKEDDGAYSGFAELNEVDKKTTVLKINGFYGSKAEMDSLVSIVDEKKYENLIIDLRDNSGGALESAFPLAEYIIDKPITAGVFPNKNWYKEFERLPNSDDYSKFTEFTGGTLYEWYAIAKQNYGAYYKVIPSKKHFEGTTYILTNNITASTCEPFVYGLKYHNFATVIGEHTAGAMLASKQFTIQNEITVVIPVNDYITYSGERLDKNGIEPDLKVKSDDAMDYTLNQINVGKVGSN